MMRIATVALALGACLMAWAASAQTVTVQGNNTTVGNCIPFGCPGSFGPNYGFIYQNVPAFTLATGGLISFDLGALNDLPLSFNISLAQTAVNGGTTANTAGFTQVVAAGTGTGLGDTIVGNYDLKFVATSGFNFTGGGLIINLAPVGQSTADLTQNQVLVNSNSNDSSGYFVERYYYASTAGDTRSSDPYAIANFQITPTALAAPGPTAGAGIPAIVLGLVAYFHFRRRSAT